MVNKNKAVDSWFENYDNPMKEVVMAVRDVILGVDERVEEVIKWQAPTFVYKGNLASFFPKSKQHASLMFHNGASIPGKFPNLEGDGQMGRTMKFVDLDGVNKKKNELEDIVSAWIELKG